MPKGGFNMAVARAWLDICLKQHGGLCSTPDKTKEEKLEPPQPVDLLAIDLHSMKICAMSYGSEFIALSYCWPAKQYLTLLKENRDAVSTRGALVEVAFALPSTVRAAISCAEELPFRYLWIDALCIVQDDSEHKAIQLRQMDRVYSAPALTLVCAYPVEQDKDDPCSGLPGYCMFKNGLDSTQCGSRSIRLIHDLHMTVVSRCVDHVLDSTRWNTRCWTFQEHHLSRRLLYFTHVQVYWSCSCNSYCEDVVCEGMAESAFIAPGSTTWSPRSRYSTSGSDSYGEWALSRSPRGGVGTAMRTFEISLSHYTSRAVSYPLDILNFFEGVAVVMGDSMQSDF